MTTTQTPPADELHALSEQIKALETRKAELRQLMISDPSARTGNDYVAIIKDIETRRLDQKALREMYPEIADEHTYAAKETRVETHRIDHETGEIKRPSRTADFSLGRKVALKTLRIV